MTKELKRWAVIMFPTGLKGKVNLAIHEKQLHTAGEAKELIDACEGEWNVNTKGSDSDKPGDIQQ